MKSIRILLFCLAIIATMIIGTSAYAQPFRLAGDENEAPFGYLNEQNEFVGIFVDIMAETFQRLGIEIEHTPYPWKRAQWLVRHGNADGMITLVTPERLTFTVPGTVPVSTFEWVAFFRDDHPQRERLMNATSLEDFRDFKILDYIGDGWGETNLKGFQVDRSGNLPQVLKRLAAGRGDVFLQSKLLTQYTIHQLSKQAENKKLPLDRLINSSKALYTVEFKLLVAKTSPYLDKMSQIDETLREIESDGTLQAIYAEYLTK